MIAAQVIGAEKVIAALDARRANVLPALTKRVDQLALKLQTLVKASKLSGQVLRNRTGTLRRSINKQVTADSSGIVTGSVGTNLRYARAHEFGCKDVVTVREHLRRVRLALNKDGSFKTQGDLVYGPATLSQSRLLVFAKKRDKKAIQGVFTVKAHPMHMNLPERSYLRSALREMAPEIREGLNDAIRKAMQP